MDGESKEEKFLSEWVRDAVHFIERHHSITGAIPKDDDIIEYLKFTKNHPNINIISVDSLKENHLFKLSMESRGLVLNYGPGELRHVNSLTQRQMAAASLMMNTMDRRSNEKKLRDLGISTEEWNNWIQNASFAEYLRERSEVLISHSLHEAHMGLLRGVAQGNTASIKLYYEMTGRYNPQEEANVNIRLLIGQVLEAIQKHVRNPDTLNALAIELSQIAITAGSPVDGKSITSVAAEPYKELR